MRESADSLRRDLTQSLFGAKEFDRRIEMALHLPEPLRGELRPCGKVFKQIVGIVAEPGKVTLRLGRVADRAQMLELRDAIGGERLRDLAVPGGEPLVRWDERLLTPANVLEIEEIGVVATSLEVQALLAFFVAW